MEQIEKSLQLKKELDKFRPLDKLQEDRVMQKFRLDWNYHSNKIEGNSLTYGETKALILFGITAQGKPLKDHFEIRGHNEALKLVIEVVKEERPLTENFIREIHTMILKEPYEVDAITPDGKPTKRRIEIGKYKSVANHVLTKAGEIFYFASPEETPAKMNDLMDWYRLSKEDKTVNPIYLAAKFHYDFIRIHPFDDGNGRTVRILMNFILMQNGFPPVIIKTEDKENYFAVLQSADAGNIEPFVNYIAQNLNRSLELIIKAAKGESIDEPDDLDKELMLLEQRMRGVGRIATVFFTEKSLNDVFYNSIKPLSLHYFNDCSKFSKFYANLDYGIWNDETNFDLDDKIENIIKINLVTVGLFILTKKLALYFDFLSFSNTKVDNFNYSSSVDFQFEQNKYLILDSKNELIYEKLYNEYLSEEEIKHIVKLETDAHRAFIEQKIKEAESKS